MSLLYSQSIITPSASVVRVVLGYRLVTPFTVPSAVGVNSVGVMYGSYSVAVVPSSSCGLNTRFSTVVPLLIS